ncbi:MarR family winged helix-turn-helix transcriptional regulator [Paenibacillus sp. SYP-B4298]|uniref:MarR family winged helix-turn-helix transcriptional regulator n=1 Tax=Paenibacillus sp. SYP-B4298 TaxID=2996034 RepID=UPI0022DDF4F1|nr:MarR family transcriptional regulator [Paenibacillus sp. SYP-B4298]
MNLSVIDDLISAFHRMRDLKQQAYAGNRKLQERRLLMLLKDAGTSGVRVVELSRALRVTSPFVTQLLNKLESAGLIVRVREESDRRIVLVRLTAEGEDEATAILQHMHQVMVGLSERLGEEDCRTLTRLLHETFDYFDEKLGSGE